MTVIFQVGLAVRQAAEDLTKLPPPTDTTELEPPPDQENGMT